jgi:hypothetical protein
VYRDEGSGQVLRQRAAILQTIATQLPFQASDRLDRSSARGDQHADGLSAVMVSTVPPLHLVLNLGLSPLSVGMNDGLYLKKLQSFA